MFKLTSTEKPITDQWFRTTDLLINSPRFSPWAINPGPYMRVKLWYRYHRDRFPTDRPRLSLLKFEGEAMELWLAKFSL